MKKIQFKTKDEYASLPSIKPATFFMPEWYKKMSRHVNTSQKLDYIVGNNQKLKNNMTIKACPPILDYVTSGYIMPLYCDLFVENADTDYPFFHWMMDNDVMSMHNISQVEGANFCPKGSNRLIFKLNSPHWIVTPKGYSCFFFTPRYCETYGIEILPAIVDTDTYHHVNFPFVYNLQQEKELLIQKGTPMVQIVPFKREEWQHTQSVIPQDQRRRFDSLIRSSLGKLYRKINWNKKVFK